MEYSKLVAVTGLPGLYELVNSKNDGAIVRSLDDNSTKFASSRIHNFSHLESIEVFTTGDNVNLVEIFQAMEAEMVKWFDVLKKNNVELKLSEPPAEEEPEEEKEELVVVSEGPAKKEKATKTATAKKAEPKKKAEEKPAKKTAAKKKDEKEKPAKKTTPKKKK